MQLIKSPNHASTPVSGTAPPSNTSLDTSAEPAMTGWFCIQTVPSPSKYMLTQISVRTGTGQHRAMTPRPKNHNQGTYYSMKGERLYGILNYIWLLPYLIQRPIMFCYHHHWYIWFHLWDKLRKWKFSVLKSFLSNRWCIAINLRINLEILSSHDFQKYIRVLNTSMFCFFISVSTYVRDSYIYSKFLWTTSAMAHGLSHLHI